MHPVKPNTHEVLFQQKPNQSLLCKAFNECWVDFLDREPRCDYFLMLHADVFTERHGWVGEMVEAMEQHGLDVLHAPVLIKDGRGKTSTAVGSADYDHEWDGIRRLTASELKKLPVVFTIPDVLEMWRANDPPEVTSLPEFGNHGFSWSMRDDQLTLLPNTGMMMLKPGPVINRFSGFTIKDRIILKDKREIHPPIMGILAPEGHGLKHAVQVVSEDWNFGRWCAQHELRVGGIRLPTGHHGNCKFMTEEAADYGLNHDYDIVKGAETIRGI